MRYLIIPALIALTSCGNPDIDDATDAVRAELVDGPSAVFRDLSLCPSGRGYYGQVSSVGKQGSRTGFVNFIYEDGEAAFADAGKHYADLREACTVRARNS